VALALDLHVPLKKLPARLVVVQVHQADRVLWTFPALPAILRVHESPREGDPKVDVVRTTRPLKAFWTHPSERSVTATVFELA